jgi:hypothetical protein
LVVVDPDAVAKTVAWEANDEFRMTNVELGMGNARAKISHDLVEIFFDGGAGRNMLLSR